MRGRVLAAGALGLLVVPALVVWLVLAAKGPESARGARASGDTVSATSARPARSLSEGGDAVQRARGVATSDPLASRAILRAALAERPGDVAVMSALAQKLLLDESTEARGLAERCLAVSPADATCKEVFRRALEPERRDDRTSKFLDDCLAKDATRLPCLAATVVERLRARDTLGAEGVLRHMRETAPDQALTTLASARVLSAEGRYAEALALFDTLCKAGQEYACFRAEALRRDGW